VTAVLFMVLGLILMIAARISMPDFFRRSPEVVPEEIGRSVSGRADAPPNVEGKDS
jgi:hypothetical protein